MAIDIISHATLPNGLIAAYPLRNHFDQGGNALHLAPENGPPNQYLKMGRGYVLNGTNQCLVIDSSSLLLAPADGLSLSFWTYLRGSAARQWQSPLARFYYATAPVPGESGLCYLAQFDYSSKNCTFAVGSGTASGSTSSNFNIEGKWVHWVCTYDKSFVRLYLNGSLVGAPAAFSGTLNQESSLRTIIGSRMGDGGLPASGRYDHFNGAVQDVYLWNRALNTDEIAYLNQSGKGVTYSLAGVTAPTDVLTSPQLCQGLIAAYDMEDSPDDGVGNFNATPVNSPTYVTGKMGKAISLNGSNQYLNLGTDNRLTPRAISICAWVKFNSVGGVGSYPGVMGRRDTGIWSYSFGGADGQRWSWAVTCAGGMDYLERTWTDPTEWHFLVVTYDGNVLRMSIDAGPWFEKYHGYAGPILHKPTQNAVIGYTWGYGTGYFNGLIDGVRVYDRAITAEEVYQHYASGVGLALGSKPAFTTLANHPSLRYRLQAFHLFDNDLLDEFGPHPGTYASGSPAYISGKFGNALSLDGGAGHYLTLAQPIVLDLPQVTFAGWVYVDSSTGQIAGKSHDTNGVASRLYISGGNWTFGGYTSAETSVTLSVLESGWTYVLASFDGYHLRLQVNARTASQAHGNPGDIRALSTTDFAYGANASGSNRWNGGIDHFGIWDRPLLPSEETDLRAAGAGLAYGSLEVAGGVAQHETLMFNLIGCWPLDDSGNDVGPHGFHGSLVNTPAQVTGKVDGAYKLGIDSKNLYFDCHHYNGVFDTPDFSFCVWNKAYGHPTGGDPTWYQGIVTIAGANPGSADNVRFQFGQYSTVLGGGTAGTSMVVRNSGWSYFDISTPYSTTGEWVCWLITVSTAKRTLRLYKDGMLVKQGTFVGVLGDPNSDNFPLRVGYKSNGANPQTPTSIYPSTHIEKDMDHFLWWDRELTPKEVMDMYATEAGLPYSNPARAPQLVATATILSGSQIRVDFDELMEHNAALTTAGNYQISGPTTIEVIEASAADVGGVTQVTLTLDSEMRDGGAYEVEASGMIDANDGLEVDPAHNTASFTGAGVSPQVAGDAVEVGDGEVLIQFSEAVLGATTIGNYSIDPPIDLNSAVLYDAENFIYRITTGYQTPGLTYTLTVGAGVTDSVGNPINASFDEVIFEGYTPTATQATYRRQQGLIEAMTGAVGEAATELAGFCSTKLTAAVAEGVTTFPVETTEGWQTSGRLGLDGVLYTYSGKTATTLTGIAFQKAGESQTGAATAHRARAAVVDVTRTRSYLEQLRRALLVEYAEGEDLNALARNLGIPRHPVFREDSQFREIVKAVGYNPKGSMLGLELALTGMAGAGNFEIYEDLIRYPNRVFVQLTGGALIHGAGVGEGKSWITEGAWDALRGSFNTLDMAAEPLAVYGVQLKPLAEEFSFRLNKPSDVTYAYYPGAIPANAFTYAGGLVEGSSVAVEDGQTKLTAGSAGTVFYRMLDTQGARLTEDSEARVAILLLIPTGASLKAGELSQASLALFDGNYRLSCGLDDDRAFGLFATSAFLGSTVTLELDRYYSIEMRKTRDGWVELWVDGIRISQVAYSAFSGASTTDHQIEFGIRGTPNSGMALWIKQLRTNILTPTNYWSAIGADATVDDAALTQLVLSGAGHTFQTSDVGKPLRTYGSAITNAQGGNNNGRWRIATYIDSTIVTLRGFEREGAATSSVNPTRIVLPTHDGLGQLVYPDDLGKRIQISDSTQGKDGIYTITKIFDPVSGADYATEHISGKSLGHTCEVSSASFATEVNLTWELLPNFEDESNLSWEQSGASAFSGTVLTLRRPLWKNDLIMEILSVSVHSAQMLIDQDQIVLVNDEGPPPTYTFYPWYVTDPLGVMRLYVDQITAAGVVPEYLIGDELYGY